MANGFKYQWITKADMDAYFGLLFDGFAKVIIAVGIMIYAFKMPMDIVLGKILPGLAIATLFGNLVYAYEAYSLAKKEGRQNVTAQPYGVGAIQILGWLFLIIGPVYWDTGNAMFAWQVGLAACFIGGLLEIAGAAIGKQLVRWTPTAALLGNLAAGAIVWVALVSIFEIYDQPLVALIPLFIILTAFFGKLKMPFNMPAGFLAVLVGTIIAWLTGLMNTAGLVSSADGLIFYAPSINAADIGVGMQAILKYLPIIIPLQIANFLSTIQGVESANLAGDKYSVRKAMLIDGAGTIVGSLFGNPFPTTIYYGQPKWKELGARSGYSILTGITYMVIGFTGIAGLVAGIIPYQAVMAVLVFAGLAVGAQAFTESEKKHAPAILLGLLPLIALYVVTAINETLAAAGTNLATIGLDSFQSSFPIKGIMALSQGAFLSGLLITAILVHIIDEKFRSAAMFSIASAICALIGLIHAPAIKLAPASALPFAAVYLILAIACLLIDLRKAKMVDPDLIDLSSGDSTPDEEAAEHLDEAFEE